MRRTWMTLVVALMFAISSTACKKKEEAAEKEKTKKEQKTEKKKTEKEKKQQEAKKEETKKQETAKQQKEAKEKQEELKKKEEELKKKMEEAKKKEEELKKKVEEAKKREEEAKKKAQEAKRVALQTRKKNAQQRLSVVTAGIQKYKTELLAQAKQYQANKQEVEYKNRDSLGRQFAELEADTKNVEALLASDNLEDAETKLTLLEAKYKPLQENADKLLAEKPISRQKWEAMLVILANEICFTKAKLPADQLQEKRDALFGKYQLDRVTYEALRAKHQQNPRPEDAKKLNELVAKLCPKPEEKAEKAEKKEEKTGETNKEEKDKKKEEAKKEEKKKVAAKRTYTGHFSTNAGPATITLIGKGDKLLSGAVKVGTTQFILKGSFSKRVQLSAKKGMSYIRCKGTKTNEEIKGTCHGVLAKKKFSGNFTAKRKK